MCFREVFLRLLRLPFGMNLFVLRFRTLGSIIEKNSANYVYVHESNGNLTNDCMHRTVSYVGVFRERKKAARSS